MLTQIIWLISLPVVMFITYRLVAYVTVKFEKKQLL